MPTKGPAPSAEAIIRDRIRASGRIIFAEFMEFALYGEGGYYTSGDPIGERGDYYTSPSAHPVFGSLAALQLEQMWELLGKPDPFHAVEPGAGAGTLAADILAVAQRLDPDFQRALRYTAMDLRGGPSDARQAAGLDFFQGRDMQASGIVGCILSNELIDALPVHRVSLRDGRLRELYVTIDKDRFAEVWDEPSTPEIAARLALECATLGEGCEGEVSLPAARWVGDAAASLDRGYVLTIDYGDLVERLYSPQRPRGTVMSYYRHTPQSDPYARIGRQDITAHANFTTLVQAGRANGLAPIALITQREFLRNLGIDLFIEAVNRLDIPDAERQANTMAMRDLIRADGLGNFRVLLQCKNAPSAGLACLGPDPAFTDRLRRRLHTQPPPLLDHRHINLMAGRFPGSPSPETWITGSWEDILGGE